MSRYSKFAPIALLLAGIAFFPVTSHAQSALCTSELRVAASYSDIAEAQDAAGNAAAALASDAQARAEMMNASASCSGTLTGQNLALFQNLMSIANQLINQASVANQLNQTAQAQTYEVEVEANLDQALAVALRQ